MKARIGPDRLCLVLLLGALLGLFILGQPASLFAELDEPPVLTEAGEDRGTVPALQGGASGISGQPRTGLDSEQAASEAVVMDNLRLGVLQAVSWVLLAVGLMLVSLTLRKTYVWFRAMQKSRVPPTRYFNLQLQVRTRDGEMGLYNFDYYPVVVAASGNADTRRHRSRNVHSPRVNGGKRQPAIRCSSGRPD